MVKSWIEDAKEYEAIADLAASGIYQTTAVREYLDVENKHRTVVLAPKGCGKTLLIKHKRKSLQDQGGWTLLPQNQLVAQPAHAPGFDNDRMGYIREHTDYWSLIWQIAIVLTVLRHGRCDLTLESPRLRSLWSKTDLDDPFHIFVDLLNFMPQDFRDTERDFNSVLLPAFAARKRDQTAIFIDNVDECFGGHLERAKRVGLYGMIAREFWHDAQIGLLVAARRISSHNGHVKVFGTIRTEAFSARQHRIPDLANVRTHMTAISFDKQDLKHIFEENIRNEVRDRLVDPTARDPFVRFFGQASARLRHPYTGRFEHVFDYIHRHTFGRPRDLMTIGRELSAVSPERRTSNVVRDKINTGAAAIATSYLTEVAPHFDWFHQDVMLAKFQSNAVTADDLARVELEYDRDKPAKPPEVSNDDREWFAADGRSATTDMYAAGLIGVAQRHPVLPKQTQHFTSVFDMFTSLSRERQTLPQARSYLVHNVLGSYVRRRYGGEWHPHTVNIVEPGGDWLDDDGFMYVLQIDVQDSTRLRSDPLWADRFHIELERAVAWACDGILFREPYAGDAIALADPNGFVLVRATHRIAQHLKTTLDTEIRAGLDFGPVVIVKNEQTGQRRLDRGTAIWRSARLQASSGPGALLTLPAVVKRLAAYEVDWPFFELTAQNKNDGFRARRVRQKWSIAEKTKPKEADLVDQLMVLPLHELKFEQ
jgi:class 3 adenylate cyclase